MADIPHFNLCVVPAGEWRRLRGTNAKGGEGPRPHLVPVSDRAKNFVSFLALTGQGCGVCPGEIKVGEAWELALRFVTVDDGALLIKYTTELMERVEAACKAD